MLVPSEYGAGSIRDVMAEAVRRYDRTAETADYDRFFDDAWHVFAEAGSSRRASSSSSTTA